MSRTFEPTSPAVLQSIVRHVENWRREQQPRPSISQVMNRKHYARLIELAEDWETEAAVETLAGRPKRAWYLEQLAQGLRDSAPRRVEATAQKIRERAS